MINSRYPIASFRDILSRVERPLQVQDLEEYDCVGIKLYGQGAFVRERRQGFLIKRKTQWVVRAGDVLYNKLFAWKGTFCIASGEVDSCIVSDKFPTYIIRSERILPEYLALWFQTEELAREAQHLSKGAAALSKLTLNPPDFWKLPIPLPDIEEQGRVIGHLKSALANVDAVLQARARFDAVLQGRRAGIGSELRHIMSAALIRLETCHRNHLGILDDVLIMRPRSGPSFPCSQDSEGISVVMPSALGGYRFDAKKCLFGFGNETLTDKDFLKPGDLLFSRGNKRDQVGLCVVYESEERRTYANLLMRMQVDPLSTLPHFIKYWLMTPIAIDHIRRHTKGTSPSVQKINQKGIVSIPFPEGVDISQQRKWIEYLNRAFDGVDRLEAYARDQYELVVTLRRSILSTAFRGLL